MPITTQLKKLQEEMQQLQTSLISQTEKYRVAMNTDVQLYLVKNLYQKLKATSRELRLLIVHYEQIINTQMEAYDKTKQNSN